MSNHLDRSNTGTTFSSFFHPPSRPRPPPQNVAYYPRRAGPSSSIDRSKLRASKLGRVEHMTSRERIERWTTGTTTTTTSADEPNRVEAWRIRVAHEVARETRREEHVEPSVVTTTSSMKSATAALRDQLESSSLFASSFVVDRLETPVTSSSEPSSSVVRESFLCDARPAAAANAHPYSQHTFTFDERTGTLVTAHPRPAAIARREQVPPEEETLLLAVPSAPETCASVSPIDPAFAVPPTTAKANRFPFAQQRHPLPRIDTSAATTTTPVTASSWSAPVVESTYPSFARPPRSSSLPFHDLASIEPDEPSPPPLTPVPPPVPPKDGPTTRRTIPDPAFALLPPKAAALLGLIPTAAPTPRPRPRFATPTLGGSFGSSSTSSMLSPHRSSFYTNYDGPRPSVESSAPTLTTMLTSPLDRTEGSSSNAAKARPPPLTLVGRREGMSSLPDLHESAAGASLRSLHLDDGSSSSSVSSSLAAAAAAFGRASSLDTPRSLQFINDGSSSSLIRSVHQVRFAAVPAPPERGGGGAKPEGDESDEVESLILPSPSPSSSSLAAAGRFGRAIGQDLPRTRPPRGGGGGGGGGLARSISLTKLKVPAAGLLLTKKLSLKQRSTPSSSSSAAAPAPPPKTETETKRKKSLRDLKRGFDHSLEQSFRYW
ncbi:hypothetical protein JCM11491_000002 [Sporobolomyces phaffii]